MSHCFMLGSPKDATGKHRLRVLHSIEYLTYDLKACIVDVWGDFFVLNQSDAAARLRGLHQGNIRFRPATSGWSADKRWTPVLQGLAGKAIGLRTTKQGGISLCEAGSRPLDIHMASEASGELSYWTPPPSEDGRFVCFTGWESPELPAGQCSLVRVAGTCCGETYEHLMPRPSSGDPIEITGGEPLRKEIRKEIAGGGPGTEGLAELYARFEADFYVEPQFYHIFFERRSGNPFKPVVISTGVRVRKENVPTNGRRVSWVWSDSDFNVYAKANGPVLELVER